MTPDYFAVIMAGGGGTRLWPLSRRSSPKQSLRIFGDQTLFQMAVGRLKPILNPAQIYVVTVEEQAKLLMPQAPELPSENYILEPDPRGTASVVGLATVLLSHLNPDCTMAILTADHFISNVAHFQKLLLAAYDLAKEGDLITLGISPRYPDTGYGYIQRGDLRGTYRGFEAYQVEAFKEKPGLEQAEAYLLNGGYDWNSGMFVWKVDRIMSEIERQMPVLYSGLMEIKDAIGSTKEREVLQRVWMGLESETIDYGVMEGADQVSVIPAGDLGWSDVGGWRRLFEILEQDDEGNVLQAPHTLIQDMERSLIYQSLDIKAGRLIATLGIEDLIIVDTENVLLVCKRQDAEQVRRLVHHLEDEGFEEYV